MKINLSRQAIRDLIAVKFPRLKNDPNSLRDPYFLDSVRRHGESTRIIRVLPTAKPDVCEVKFSVSSLAGIVRSDDMLDADGFAEAVAEEIVRFEEGVPADGDEELFESSAESAKTPKLRAHATQRAAFSSLRIPTFEYRPNDVNCSTGLIYFFEILNAEGVPVSSYVGQSFNSERPFKHYAVRTAQVMAGIKGRPVHEAMRDAVLADQKVVCTLLCNAGPHEINEVETALIRELDCYGQGAHQLNKRPGSGPHGRPTPEHLRPLIAAILQRRRSVE